jgi:hypothetical protein
MSDRLSGACRWTSGAPVGFGVKGCPDDLAAGMSALPPRPEMPSAFRHFGVGPGAACRAANCETCQTLSPNRDRLSGTTASEDD